MKKSHCLLFMLLLLLGGTAMAQKKVVTGKVLNQATNEPLEGVNILADKQKGGTTTKADGTYSISVDTKTTTLIFSYVGFASQTVVLGDKIKFDIVMVPAATTNDEVVVIGYGTQKKSHLTGAITKYQNDRLEETPSSRLDQALQGKIAGVQIQNISSESGADTKVRVRGVGSIYAGAEPLVVVDGHPVPDGLSFVNMADVASVEVLKDAASAAIYGSRGASGVIIITTKSGKSNRPKFNVKFSVGSKEAYELYPMMTTTEYLNLLYYEAALKAKDPSVAPPTQNSTSTTAERGAYIIEQQLRHGQGTDWQREAIRTANVKNLQMSVSGGSSALRYFFSGGYQNDQGMMYHSEYERFNVRSKIDADLSKKVKFSLNLNPSYIKRERPSVNYIDFVRFQSYLPVYLDEELAAYVRQDPQWADVKAGDFAQARYFNGRVYNGVMPDGSMWVNSTAITPFNTANNTPKSVMETRAIISNDYRVLSSGDLTFNIIPGLDLKITGSAYVSYRTSIDFAKRNSNRAGEVNRGVYNNNLNIDLLNENTLTYKKQIKQHSINLLAGFTAQKTRTRDEQIIGTDFPSDNIQTANNALVIMPPTIDANGSLGGSYTLKNSVGLLSYLGRLTYDFKNRYLLSASIRADGSSMFAPGHKWGYFPSVSAGWVLSQEKFFEKISWISNLKLRGSYGASGNNRILPFAWIDLLYPANYPIGAGNGSSGAGFSPSREILANEGITWERTFQFNGGLDLALFKNAITIGFDIYQSKTDKLLLRQNTLAFSGAPFSWNNIGSLKNNGIELEITTNNIRNKNFKWTTSANIAHNRNEILELGSEPFFLNSGERSEQYINKVGGPLVQFFGYKTDGVWLSQQQITDAGLSTALPNGIALGGVKLVDLNGDKKIDDDDRTELGDPYPDFTWGLTNNFTYRNFDLSFMLQGVQGGSLVNGDINYQETRRYNSRYTDNRWVSPLFQGDGKTVYSTVGFNPMLTDYVIEDASYYALREVIVGYTLPDKLVKKTKLGSLRVYFSAQNLYFHNASGYRGINTEGRFTSAPFYSTPLVDGYQRGSFPIAKTFTFGIDLNF
ncbi:MAG TPA: TonB-dependent receptor [Chitinophagaceae bacterium]|jgi:TonB-linked SusC/RagA family outer membrane protein|nr:TonB-dependent receptor [Chitinophagaceae bacterium]